MYRRVSETIKYLPTTMIQRDNKWLNNIDETKQQRREVLFSEQETREREWSPSLELPPPKHGRQRQLPRFSSWGEMAWASVLALVLIYPCLHPRSEKTEAEEWTHLGTTLRLRSG
ncbi:hypothetical protein BU17DRAFT_69538 [Hysterangium stoloniferum]|nr:hypothetical protein BU17DRAFT_69538 [Hysterangium stoloniferum]